MHDSLWFPDFPAVPQQAACIRSESLGAAWSHVQRQAFEQRRPPHRAGVRGTVPEAATDSLWRSLEINWSSLIFVKVQMSQSTLHNPSHLCQHLHCFKPFPRWSSSRCSSTACDNIRGTLGNSRQWFMREMMLMLQDFNYTLSYMVSCASSHTLLQHQGIPRSVFKGRCNVCNVLCKQGTPKHLISELKSANAASQPYADSTVQVACSSPLSHPCNEFCMLGSPSQAHAT